MDNLIKKNLKNIPIYSPMDYFTTFRTSMVSPRSYEVKSLNHCFFKNYGQVSTFKTIRPGQQKGAPTVNDLRCLKYSPDGELSYKLTFDRTGNFYLELRGKNQLRFIQLCFTHLSLK
ncbi:cobyric acid synthase [Plakobranchus ocellatus]|uniref:Cobyric acid synthase n=1 Tax=Plakobranchus ocellatus TaxID=259542 RepID=A0AAV4A8G7_9GAST|nr:cobyric acid synthase [Plakobranchus ocellatus]